jgi:predicted kinase
MKTLYLICGPSGSGKTTFANKLKKEKGITNHFEADQWMVDLYGNYFFDPKRLSYCHTECQKSTEESMQRGEDVIVSNTTLTKKEAKPYIDLTRKYGYNVEIHHMTGEYQNEHGVPYWKIEEMRNKRQWFSLADFEA